MFETAREENRQEPWRKRGGRAIACDFSPQIGYR
jgi:hypothetical protein